MTKLIMKLFVEGKLKQKLEADLAEKGIFWDRKIVGMPKVREAESLSHINPEGVNSIEDAYKIFEAIRHDYEMQGKKPIKIIMTYQ